MTVAECVELLKASGSQMRPPVPVGDLPPMVFGCSFGPSGAAAADIEAAGGTVPDDVREFWNTCAWARLFEDRTYGQWGLCLLTPQDAAQATEALWKERRGDYVAGDLVVGRFVGDSNLLLVRCDDSKPDYGSVIVVEPIYGRSDWSTVAESFGGFLCRYVDARGEKYWESKLR